MDQRRAILIVLAFFQVLLAARVLMGAVIEFQQQELNRKRRRIIKKRSREDDELAMTGVSAAIQQKRIVRRFWVDARSNHWITRVLDGMLLRAAEFDNIFRMSRNSFNLLHGLLGIPA